MSRKSASSTTTISKASRPMSWPSSPPTTSPSTSRRCGGGRPTKSSARPGPKTRQSSRSTRTISFRDHTPSPPSPSSQKPSGNSHMTANDFFLLFAAFGGFVIAPALLLWGFARITNRKRGGTSSPDIRPDVDSSDASSGGGRREAARSGKANRFLRQLTGSTDTASRPCPPPRVRGSRCASLAPLPLGAVSAVGA